MLHDWFDGTDIPSELVDIVLIDFQKAFDYLNHNIIVQKCRDMGVPDFLVDWVSAFLADRCQRVKIGETYSSWATINGGVPQGTKLGPLLFVIQINDLDPSTVVPSIKTTKFMDDTTEHESRPVIGPSQMEGALDYIDTWSGDNNMKLNQPKTKHMQIKFSKSGQPHTLELQSNQIERVKHVKLLGLRISDDLKWDLHISTIVRKASQRLRFLTVSKKAGMSDSQMLKVYNSRIRPILEYAAPAWQPGLTQAQTGELEYVQKRAFRIIWPYRHYKDCLEMNNISSLQDRRLHMCKDLYEKMKIPDHPLHSLLPPVREQPYQLRRMRERTKRTRTKRAMGSFVNYAISKFE